MKDITWHDHTISREDRLKIKNQKALLFWLTGFSASGKSTLANQLEEYLNKMGKHTYLLDGDNVRTGLCSDLDFSPKARNEHFRRIGEVSKLMIDAGVIVIAAFVSPKEAHRDIIKNIVGEEFVHIVHVNTSIEECENRDPKGLFKKARAGEIPEFPGINSEYQIPENPSLSVNADQGSRLKDFAEKLV